MNEPTRLHSGRAVAARSRLARLAASVALAAALSPGVGALQKRTEDERPPVPRELQVQIDRAIDRGVEALLEQQEVDGSWRHDLAGYGPGATGLVAYTLMKCGVPHDHPAILRAFEFMRRQPATRTYTVATILMAMAARGEPKDRKWAEELSESLISWKQNGGWGYPDQRPDLSNTQFAGLGLRAADALGVVHKQKVWDQLGEVALDYLEAVKGSSYDPAGFFYERGDPLSTGSMTAAGLTLVAIAVEHVQGSRQALIVAQERALLWMGKNFSVAFNPKPGSESGKHGWDYYYLYGLERVGSLLELDEFGGNPWYELGARRLVDEQNPRGRWSNQADTCFALLFLARATGKPRTVASGATVARAPSERGLYGKDDPLAEVSLRASGTSELTIWVSSFGDRIVRMYAPDEAGKQPLPIKRVEYLIAEVPSDQPLESIATVLLDPSNPPANGRFPIKHTPIGPAEYDLVARVTLVDFADGAEIVLESKPLRVRVGLTEDPRSLRYAADSDRNELANLTIKASASSQMDGADNAPEKALDNLQGTGWRSNAADATPWILLEFERPPRAGTLLLAPSLNPADEKRTPRPTAVRILMNNDEKSMFECPLDPNPRIKTEIPLPKGLRLRSLRITLLSPTAATAGLNEIELQTR
ncbi:MAG: hypothetical protein R3F49_06535 [Planctomycetota bacterium]